MDHEHGMHYQTHCEQQITMIGSAKISGHTFSCKHTNKLPVVKHPHNGNISWCAISSLHYYYYNYYIIIIIIIIIII